MIFQVRTFGSLCMVGVLCWAGLAWGQMVVPQSPVRAIAFPPPCVPPASDPPPVGTMGRPIHTPDVILPGLPDFSVKEYAFSHSMTHLQGKPAKTKYATGLIYDETFQTDFHSWTSAIVVNNPHPSQSVSIAIRFFATGVLSLPQTKLF